MTYLQKLKKLDTYRSNGKHAERICAELSYLDGISKNEDGKYNCLIERAADMLLSAVEADGVITKDAVLKAEESLMELKPVAKKYTELFISHAHIDMNWMWGYNETAAVTVDTFRTVLDLMREHPDMTFCQSQASTYEIIDKYCPELLPEIKKMIKEGRWEVTASEWVEPDKNMPDGESLTRQILQARKYLTTLLDISEDSLNINFVPDTFGHNLNVPEILAGAGVKYMYHCRGHKGPCIYRYQSPSGKSVLTYCEYAWYNGEIGPSKFEMVPKFCANEKVNTYLCVFGVGDHGGGPSRRDIERIKEYQSWPLTPSIRFGTFREFFEILEHNGNEYPIYDTERNFLFTGCYTTQSRIKMSNRIAETRINETEALSAMASVLVDAPLEPDRLDSAWRNVLFNHFHDILPGSGTIETREFAMGRFQEAMADINIYGNLSIRRISNATDTSTISFEEVKGTTSEGSGTGFYQSQNANYRYSVAERGSGPVRAFQLFNTTSFDRDEYTEITVWDYGYSFDSAVITDMEGNEIPFTVINSNKGYWGHIYSLLLVKATVKAFGYTTIILKQREPDGHKDFVLPVQERVDKNVNDEPFVMENDLVKAIFDKKTCRLTSLINKKTGASLIEVPSCYFKYIDENPIYGRTSWRIGPYMNVRDLNAESGVRYTGYSVHTLYSRLSYEMKFGTSNLTCTITLKKDSPTLEFELHVDWSESAVRGQRIPQLAFSVPVSYDNGGKFSTDIPYGVIKRQQLAHDVPALSYICADNNDNSIALLTDSKYGYRYYEKEMSVTLIRSAYDPDPYPERGIHDVRIGVTVSQPERVKDISVAFCRPIAFLSATKHNGILPLEGSALTVRGNISVSVIKNAENGNGIAVRVYDTTGKPQTAVLTFCRKVKDAYICESTGKKLEKLLPDGKDVTVNIPAFSVVTIVIGL